jgi:uncharacterized protein (DUF488 family)
MKYSKKAEVQKQINFVFKDFTWDNASEKIATAHNLLKAYEQNKDIAFYDIEEDLENKKITIKIKPHNESNIVFKITDDGK